MSKQIENSSVKFIVGRGREKVGGDGVGRGGRGG